MKCNYCGNESKRWYPNNKNKDKYPSLGLRMFLKNNLKICKSCSKTSKARNEAIKLIPKLIKEYERIKKEGLIVS